MDVDPSKCFISRLNHDILAYLFETIAAEKAEETYTSCREIMVYPAEVCKEDLDDVLDDLMWTPFFFASICRQWWRVCERSGAAWSYVQVPFIGGYYPGLRRHIEDRVARAVTATAGHGLRVDVFAFDSISNSMQEEASRRLIQKMLWKESDRWLSLRILQSPEYAYGHWEKVISIPMRLRRLHIMDPVFSTWSPAAFLRWPNITSVSLDIRADSIYGMRLMELKVLEDATFNLHPNCEDPLAVRKITYTTYRQTLDLVAGSTSLRSLRITTPDKTYGRPKTWTSPPQIISSLKFHFPNLEILVLEGYDERGPSWIPFVRSMVVPCLRRIRVDEPDCQEWTDVIRSFGRNLESIGVTMQLDQPFYQIGHNLVDTCRDINSLEVYALGQQRSFSVMEQLTSARVFPQLRRVVFGLRQMKRYKAMDDLPPVGFDDAYSLLKFLHFRRDIRHITAAVDCELCDVQMFKRDLDRLDIDYCVWAFAPEYRGFLLKKDADVVEVDLRDIGVVVPEEVVLPDFV